MADEITLTEKIIGAVLLAMGGGMGLQRYQQSRIEKAIDEHSADIKDLRSHVRSKEDCGDICMSFQKTMERMSDKMDEGFQRIYDKLEKKEDKH